MGDRLDNRAERLRCIERLLFGNPEGMRAVEIAHATGVDRRTVYRDLETLARNGVPLWQEAGRFGVERGAYLATVSLGVHEAMVLYLAANLFAAHTDNYQTLLAACLARLAAAFPEPASASVTHSAEAVKRRANDADHSATLEVIATAWAVQRLVRVWYWDAQYDVSVYLVMPTDIGDVYIVGMDSGSGKVCTFKLDWVQRAQLLDARCTLPADFDAAQFAAQAWQPVADDPMVEVVLRFSPAVAPVIKARRWHPSQKVVTFGDGSCQLTMQLSDLRDVRAWVLSWGAAIRVVAPPTLREDVAQEARRMAGLYPS